MNAGSRNYGHMDSRNSAHPKEGAEWGKRVMAQETQTGGCSHLRHSAGIVVLN